MTRRVWRRLALVAVVAAAWVALMVHTTSGPRPQEFHKTAVQAAQGALDATRTAQLAGQAGLHGRAFRGYLRPVLDNSRQGVGTSLRRMAELPPSGEAERQVRDELRTLLNEADRSVGDLTEATEHGQREAIATAAGALSSIGDRLADFVLRQRA